MKTILGFSEYLSLISNVANTINPIGECSKIARTFTKDDLGVYTASTAPNVNLLVFAATNETNTAFSPDTTYTSSIIALLNYILVRAADGRFTSDAALALQQLQTDFGTAWSNLSIGAMVTDGVNWAPEYVTGSLTRTDAEVNTIKIWLADLAFRDEYPRYAIGVVHPVPIANIDVLAEDFATFAAAINAVSKGDIGTELQAVIGSTPQTGIMSLAFNIYDQEDPSKFMTGYWQLPYWGNAAQDEDAKYGAITEAILAASQYDETVWAKIIPDLFNPFEFIIAPDWEAYSIPNKTTETGIHSPVFDYQAALNVPTRAMPWFTQAQIIAGLVGFPALYQSLALYTVGKPTNRNGVVKLSSVFADYALISSQDTEFGKLSPATRDWIAILQRLLVAAQTMEAFTELPVGVSRVTRNGVILASASYNGMKYLVVTQPWYLTTHL